MSLIKNLYVLSVPYTHFKIFLFVSLNKRSGFSHFHEIVSICGSTWYWCCPQTTWVWIMTAKAVSDAAWRKHPFCWGQISYSQHLSHFTFACLGSSTCQAIYYVPEEILTVLKVSSLQNLKSEPERNIGWSSVWNTMSISICFVLCFVLLLSGPETCSGSV